ncbi:MAG: hypothetical protein WCD18_09480 [Thermosynechococcaceae cyanobacterium]
MVDKAKNKAITIKIKKWLEAVHELNAQHYPSAIPITRLTSLKSFCQERVAAQKFALFIAQRVQMQMQESPRPEHFSPEEWQIYLQLFEKAIALMMMEAEAKTEGGKLAILQLLREIDGLQGNNYRNIPWGTLHLVRSGDLLKLTYALQCFEANDGSAWAYKLGREYIENYEPLYGAGIIPRSIPKLLEVAEFWCEHFFQQSLTEKFPEFFPLVKNTELG